jgi:predicted ester cyclase
MSTESNKQLVRRYYDEVHSGRNYDLIDELVAPNFKEHDPLPGQAEGREGIKQRDQMLAQSLNIHFTVEDLIAERDMVVVRWRNRGTHIGEFLGIPPTGRDFSIEGINVYRVEDGRLAEGWSVADVFGQMLQLGVIPAPEPAAA